jgi:hypothetical protein
LLHFCCTATRNIYCIFHQLEVYCTLRHFT